MPLRLSPTFRDALAAASRPLAGIWVCSGSPLVAEICAGAGLDWVLIDMEHCPNGLESVLAQLQAVAAYPVTPVVRVPIGDVVTIKQVLDLGAQNLLVPMVSSADEARAVVEAVRYPPRGRRGVGCALARSARWNRVDDYLANADRPRLAVRPDRDGRRGRMPRPRSPRSTASTASSSGRPTSRRRWACSASRRIRMSSPPCCAPSTRSAAPASRSASTPSTRRSRSPTSTPAHPSCSSAPTSRCSPAAPRRSPRGSHRRRRPTSRARRTARRY